MSAIGCDFNRSMQHLNSKYTEEDVEDEVTTEDLLHRRTKGLDVGSLAERRVPGSIAQFLIGTIHQSDGSWQRQAGYVQPTSTIKSIAYTGRT